MMAQLPPPDSIAAALLVVGLLFALRYALAIRRLMQDSQRPTGYSVWHLPKAGEFGEAMEPNRRYAARQFWQAVIFTGAGIVLFAYVLAAGLPITLGQPV